MGTLRDQYLGGVDDNIIRIISSTILGYLHLHNQLKHFVRKDYSGTNFNTRIRK